VALAQWRRTANGQSGRGRPSWKAVIGSNSIGEAWLYSSYCNASLVGLVVREGRGRSSDSVPQMT
jgi:hypothetical protein